VMLNLILKYKKSLVLLLLLIAFIPYIYISFYSNPVADDFSLAFKGKSADFFQSLVNQYQNWSGRYTSNIFVLLNPIAYSCFWGYKLVPIVIIALTIIAFYFFIKVITYTFLKPNKAFVLALIATLLFIYQMPIISEGIYWYTGSVAYQLGNIFLLIYVSIFAMLFQKRYILKNKFVHILILTLTLFFAVGFNEILMIVSLLLSMIVFLVVLKNKMENKQIALFLLIVSTICSSIMYLAPGNVVRADFFPNNHQFIQSIGLAAAQTIRFFLNWISSAPLLLLSVLYYFLNKELSKKKNFFAKSFYLTPLISLLLLFFVIFIGAFPPYWSTGVLGQHRTMNISYFLFTIMWFVNLTVCFNLKQFRINEINKKWELIIFIVIWSSFVFTKNGYNAINDIQTGKAYDYNKLMIERYSILNNDKDSIYFNPIVNPPKTLFVLDITENPNHWINKGYNVYFEVEGKIMLKEHTLPNN